MLENASELGIIRLRLDRNEAVDQSVINLHLLEEERRKRQNERRVMHTQINNLHYVAANGAALNGPANYRNLAVPCHDGGPAHHHLYKG